MTEREGRCVWNSVRYGRVKLISVGLFSNAVLVRTGVFARLTLVAGAYCCKSSSSSSRPRFLEASISAVADGGGGAVEEAGLGLLGEAGIASWKSEYDGHC